MTYTKSIRKIFTIGGDGIVKLENGKFNQFAAVAELAEKSGYQALAFNGTIYILCKDDKEWCETVFTLEDFQID